MAVGSCAAHVQRLLQQAQQQAAAGQAGALVALVLPDDLLGHARELPARPRQTPLSMKQSWCRAGGRSTSKSEAVGALNT